MEGRNPAIIPQRIIPGVLGPKNDGAFDWGWQGLIACGNCQILIIIDPNTLQVVQTLVGHRQPICKVKWAKENYHHDVASPYSLRLASVDISGRVIVWDVAQGAERTEFIESGKSLNDLDWLSSQDASHDLLIAIHSPNVLVLWNADTGTKLWRKTYDNVPNLRSITIDPFEPTHFAALGADCILFVNDFSISKQPSSDGKKFYMSVDKAPKPTTPSRVNLASMGLAALSGIRLLMGEEKPKANELSLVDCKQLTYLPSMRHHLAVVFATEILIMDVGILQAVATIPLERNGSPFMQVLPVRQRSVIICAHENGSLSFRLRRFARLDEKKLTDDDEADSAKHDLHFDTVCHSEPFRITNRVRPVGATLCPVAEQRVAVLVSDGRIFVWKVSASPRGEKSCNSPFIYSPRSLSLACPKSQTLAGLLAPTQNIVSETNSGSQDQTWGESISLKFVMVGLFSSLTCQVTCMRMCPPLTHKNWPHYRPLLAVGLVSGNILIFDLGTGKLMYEYGVHACEVRGIEWSGLRSIISFGYPQSNANNTNSLVTNEVFSTNLQTGRTVPFRTDKSGESPINLIKISSKKQYLLIIFHDKPVELWDVKARCLLRELPKSFPTVHAVEWAPAHTAKRPPDDDVEPSHTKEHLILTDASATLYHCIAEGSSFKQGSRIPHVSERNSTITCITWKRDHVFMGDTDGTVNIWNLKTKMAKGIPTHRGWVKKVRFGPGKGNLSVFVLFEDGLEVWDADDAISISSVKTPKHLPKILDIDWCASDKLVLSCDNGQILILDSSLTMPPANLPTSELYYWKTLSCPYLLPNKPALIMKSMLQHGKLDMNSMEEDLASALPIQNAINSLPGNVKMLLTESNSTLTRCAVAARIFGDESEVHLWEMLSHYSSRDEKPVDTDGDLDTLCSSKMFQLSELQRSLRHGMLRNTPEHTKKCIQNLVLLGQVNKAIRLSLETEPSSESYYEDCLKSCLFATLQSNPEASQSSVKLIATNLIANGKLSEGVELLCMINKALDACRYLASHGCWELAVWLAKIRLTGAEYEEIMMRWASHLCSPRVNNKSKAVLVYISLKKFSRVLETFYQMRHFDRAAMFAQICQELNLLENDPKLKSVVDSIHSEYARFLQLLGCTGKLVKDHLSLAGDAEKNDVSEAASDDTTSSESSAVNIPSPGSSDFERVG